MIFFEKSLIFLSQLFYTFDTISPLDNAWVSFTTLANTSIDCIFGILYIFELTLSGFTFIRLLNSRLHLLFFSSILLINLGDFLLQVNNHRLSLNIFWCQLPQLLIKSIFGQFELRNNIDIFECFCKNIRSSFLVWSLLFLFTLSLLCSSTRIWALPLCIGIELHFDKKVKRWLC